MLLIFPFAYLLSFFLSLRGLWQKKNQRYFYLRNSGPAYLQHRIIYCLRLQIKILDSGFTILQRIINCCSVYCSHLELP